MFSSDEKRKSRCARAFLGQLNEGVGAELLSDFLTDRSADRRNALAIHYHLCGQIVARQVYRSLPRDARRLIDLEDVEQTALQQIHIVIERFNPDRAVPLSAYIMGRLPGAVIDELRAIGVIVRKDRLPADVRRTISLDGHGFERRRRHLPAKTADPSRQLEIRQLRRNILHSVPREYRMVVALRCFRGLRIWQAARRMKMTCDQAEKMWQTARQFMNSNGQKPPRIPSAPPAPIRKIAKQPVRTAEPAAVPGELRRQKDFRRWFVLNVPWAYRRFVAYHHLRGLDLDRTAGKLGLSAEKVRDLARSSSRAVEKAIENYGGLCGF